MIRPVALSLVLLPALTAMAVAQTPPANPRRCPGSGDLMTSWYNRATPNLGWVDRPAIGTTPPTSFTS